MTLPVFAAGVPATTASPVTVFALSGAHTGDLLLALPAIGAALEWGGVMVSGLAPRYYAALTHLPLRYLHAPTAGALLRPQWRAGQHRTEAWLDALPGRPRPARVPIPVHGLARARELLPGEAWALLSPWADFPGKRWHAAGWRAVAEGLVELGYRVALVGPPKAATMAREIASPSITDLTGRDTPQSWPALLARAALVVSTDTASVHMADALGIPVVGLYGYTRIAEFGPFWQRGHCVEADGMDAIGAEAVLAACAGIHRSRMRIATAP